MHSAILSTPSGIFVARLALIDVATKETPFVAHHQNYKVFPVDYVEHGLVAGQVTNYVLQKSF